MSEILTLPCDRERLTVAGPAQDEFTEKKSRFIGHIAPAETEEEAIAFLRSIRALEKGSDHNCYAWQVGVNDEFQRSSDAGEPNGTAGRPILENIKKNDLHDTIIVVTRYFGGILLGAGGLTRAYNKAAALAVDAAQIVRSVPALRLGVAFDYSFVGKVEGWAAAAPVTVEDRLFGALVDFICLLPAQELDSCRRELNDLTNGGVTLQILDDHALMRIPLS